MKIIADMHTHNGEVCGHASTDIASLLKSAKDHGHFAFALTDHAPQCDGTPKEYYLNNLSLAKEYDGVRLLAGMEADILTVDADFDLPREDMLKLEWVIASLHPYVFPKTTAEEHTKAYLSALKDPSVDCLGHIGREWYPADYVTIVKAVKETGKTLEINNHSFDFSGGINKACETVARLCIQYEVPVVVTSDAHENAAYGEFPHALRMLEEIDFPEYLVLNADVGRMKAFLEKRLNEKKVASAALKKG